MKIPLLYQRTEYDCGPTSLLNAISYLFPREDIPPEVLRFVMMYTLDCYDAVGEPCKSGTSRMAMLFLSNWLSQYAEAKKLPLRCEYLRGEEVEVTPHARITAALQQGGAAVLRLYLENEHYVTLTGSDSGGVAVFDPYFDCTTKETPLLQLRENPMKANRWVAWEQFERPGEPYYLGTEEEREAVLLFNQETRRTEEKTIEYFL
ncbi:MAG: C39 family peptidase [Oscillospiraceae bacterium]|jgi:hypothetical protein|nr:C39 family peptidase [Oscillospiraceae bacterium]